ncbi:MAG: response regulator transcription factor [Actinomycetia bacterium]|nr:response regulator transcription factor [Actinomycetes bacterium]
MDDSAPRHILVVDDDPTVAEVVTRYLEREGFEVEHVGDGRTAVERVVADRPALVLLDLMLPGFDGLEVCRQLHALAPVPIIMLTARGQENDRIIGLELGADDYMVKPFSPREVVSRVKAVLRRVEQPVAPAGPSVLLDGDLCVDVGAHEVTLAGEPVSLTSREFELLVFLLRQPRQAFRREDLLEQVWGYSIGDTSTVTVHVRRLREKIEADPANPCRIATVWGVGYRYEPGDETNNSGAGS